MRKMLILVFGVLGLGAMDRVPYYVEALHFPGLRIAKESLDRRRSKAFRHLPSFLPRVPTAGLSACQIDLLKRAKGNVWCYKWVEASDCLYDLVKSGLPSDVAFVVELEYVRACRQVHPVMNFDSRLMQIYSELKNLDFDGNGPMFWPIFADDFSRLDLKDPSRCGLSLEDFYNQLKELQQ